MERITIGDNSCFLRIVSTDLLADIQSNLTIFLQSRGWTRIAQLSLSASLQKHTFSALNVDGSTKRIYVYYRVVGTEISLAVTVGNETKVAGFTDAQVLAASTYAFVNNVSSQFQVIRSAAVNRLYIFANPRWCLFAAVTDTLTNSTNITGEVDINRVPTNYGYTYLTTNKPMYLAGAPVGRDITEYRLTPEELATGVTLPSAFYFYSPDQDYTFVDPQRSSWSMSRSGAVGCVEVDSINGPIGMLVDTSSLLYQSTADTIYEELAKKIFNLTSSVSMKDTVFGTDANAFPCMLLDDSGKYCTTPYRREIFTHPYSNKNFLGELQLATKNGYLGKAHGLKLSQPSSTVGGRFSESNLLADSDFNLGSGSSKKFIRVPGAFDLITNIPCRQLRYKAGGVQSDREVYYVSSAYNGYYSFSRRTVQSSIDWVNELTGAAAVTTSNLSSFLIPA